MRKTLCLVLCLLFVLCLFPFSAYAETVQAESAVLLDMNTLQVLYEKDAHKKMYPASITKILTCLIVIEHCRDFDEEVIAPADNKTSNPYYLTKSERETASEEDVARADFNRVIKPWTSSSTTVPLNVGDRYTVRDLLYAAVLGSANDACDLMAYYTADSIDAFVGMMNDRARLIGCTGSHFANTNGLPNTDHYVTAYDMALIMAEATKNETFMTFFGPQKDNRVTITEKKSGTPHTYAVGNELLKSGFSNYYSAATAGKTGYTKAAGYTLVTSATISGIDVVAVVLNDAKRSQTYTDTTRLFNSVMGNYKPIVISPSVFGTVKLEQYQNDRKIADIELTLPHDVSFWVFNHIFTDSVDRTLYADGTEISETAPIKGPLPEKISVQFSFEGASTKIAPVELDMKVTEIVYHDKNPTDNPDGDSWKTVLAVVGAVILTVVLIFFVLWVYSETVRRRKLRLKRLKRQNVSVMESDEYSEGSSEKRG